MNFVVMVCFIGSIAAWLISMLYSFVMAITKDDNWRFYAYAFCGQVLATIVGIIGYFLIITR